jgi:hypothetical protein
MLWLKAASVVLLGITMAMRNGLLAPAPLAAGAGAAGGAGTQAAITNALAIPIKPIFIFIFAPFEISKLYLAPNAAAQKP